MLYSMHDLPANLTELFRGNGQQIKLFILKENKNLKH